ncbi:flagellar basal body P-ring formation chaperone FlgA [Hasllibacter sp. MH4015]|uniref:flagellar basal body P-ring formation chaperone FlgA n=1 Tax=Hasllibacter sp. MH4015 TaxID=2854029 RepID=UPI002106185E|nr:flagellar basal body P-ring formation chaperone FlgA [Hasllibacter sp. MH4015]
MLTFLATPVAAQETVIAAGTIRGATLIGPADVATVEGATPGALSDMGDAIGMEARINLYPGRPIRPGDLRPPAIVERNEIVSLRYNHGGLLILTEGRALDRAASGEMLRVINLNSRQTVTATATGPGLVTVGPTP